MDVDCGVRNEEAHDALETLPEGVSAGAVNLYAGSHSSVERSGTVVVNAEEEGGGIAGYDLLFERRMAECGVKSGCDEKDSWAREGLN